MIKVCIFNKINDVSKFDIFKKFFECINSKIYLTCCTKTGAVYEKMLDSERRMVTAGIYRNRRLSVGSGAESKATRNWKRSRTAQNIAENVFFSVKLSHACEFRFILKTVRREGLLDQRVKIGDVLSDWLPVIAGMPQGSYLGPLTFEAVGGRTAQL